ncbi:MFS transporter [Streptomyces boluensis]|uniref:MFS transporter n=1 Tax=Streptomyces boluensis TaxID=1775135 RepID=A0A964UN81_9ACTN|nr:MFS transporter [Streptomyces boluensis]NBE50027.1 MFS transporter [Streptomyces boluensis]
MTSHELTTPTAPPAGEPTHAGKRAWGITFTIVLLYVVNYADKAVLGIAAQPLSEELGLTHSQIGLIGSAFFLTFTIGGLLSGPLHRLVSMRWLLVLLAAAWAACMLPTVIAASFTVLLVSRLLLGLFEGPTLALVHTAIYAWHPKEKRALPSACITGSAAVAKILAAPALAAIAATWGWRTAFLTLAGVGAAWVLLWLPVWREGPYGAAATSGKRHGDASPEAEAADGGTVTAGEPAKVPWLRIFRTPTFLASTAAVFSAYGLSATVLTWLPSYFEQGLGYSQLQAGSMFAIPSVAGLVFIFGSTFISDRLMSRGASGRVLRGVVPGAALLVTFVSLVVLPHLGTPALAVATVSLGYGISTMTYPLFTSGISQLCPPSQLAGTLGVFTAIMSIGGLISPYLTGAIVDAAQTTADGYALSFQVYGAAAGIAGLLALLAVNPERDARRLLG